jgi:hypothetical protein
VWLWHHQHTGAPRNALQSGTDFWDARRSADELDFNQYFAKAVDMAEDKCVV